MASLRFRQVHLDFHTSPLIEDVGSEFDAEEFATTVKNAYVDSITCFAKCHHGMSYYPTKIGVMHPHLKFDMLGSMIEACHRHGIRVPVYYSICWDNYTGIGHPEWLQCDQQGHLARPAPYEAGWYTLCMNSPYVDYVSAQVEEILKQYQVNGFFFDIVRQIRPGCLCPSCRKSMEELGLDIANERDLRKHSLIVEGKFLERMKNLVHSIQSDATIFFNGQVDPGLGAEKAYFTHVEIESLPTAFWGYHHFPFYVRFCRTLFEEVLGMTARFHKSWADFGGVKTKAQLEYECATMLANGAKCSIGDQLHPRGRLDKAVYDLIGSVYKSVAEKEPWCEGAEPYVQVAVLLLEDAEGDLQRNDSSEGATKILMELKHQFNVIDPWEDFDRYQLIVLPDSGLISCETAEKLDRYIAKGGSLLLSHEATLDAQTRLFRCPKVGIEYIGPSVYSPDYIRLNEEISANVPRLDIVMYERGSYVKPLEGTDVLAKVCNPYFNRTFRAFTSHRHTPVDRESPYPAVTKCGKVVYIYAPIFKAYYEHGYFAYKNIVENCIRTVLPERLVRTDAPPSSEVSLTRQGSRILVHVVNFQPQRRGKNVEYIEEAYPVRNISLEVRTQTRPKSVYLAPSKTQLDFKYEEGCASCIVPEVSTHQIVVFQM